MPPFHRVLTLGDAAFRWKARALATVHAGAEVRTIHEDGAIIAWEAAGAPRTCVQTGPTRSVAWVDERLARVHCEPPSYRITLQAVGEPSPRWTLLGATGSTRSSSDHRPPVHAR